VAAHVRHQQQRRAEALAARVARQDPLVRAAMLPELLLGAESLAALRTEDLVALGLLVAPAACVFLVFLEVRLAVKPPQTRHAVDALWLALVLAIQFGQAEVAAAPQAGVRQQADVGEAVLQQGRLPGELPVAVRAHKLEHALPGAVALEGTLFEESAATLVTGELSRVAHVHHDVLLTLFMVGEHSLANITLVELLFKVRLREVRL